MNPETLRANLDHLANLETSECMDGSLILRFDGMMDYGLLQPWLQANDAELKVCKDGTLQVRRLTETARYETDKIEAEKCDVVECGPIRQLQHTKVETTSATLDAFLRKPTILKIHVGETGVNVDELKPSILKNGLAHRKRRGEVNFKYVKTSWPATSLTQRRAANARKRSKKWYHVFR